MDVRRKPVLRDPSGQRALEPGTLVAFPAGPGGARTFDGPGRVVVFSVGALGWGEAFTSVYLDAEEIGGKPGVQFLRTAALETWTEPAAVPVQSAPAGPCPQIGLRSLPADDSHLAERLYAQTWAPPCTSWAPARGPARTAMTGAASTGRSCSAACRHCATRAATTSWRLATSCAFPKARVARISSSTVPRSQLGLLICSAPVTGPSAAVYPDDDTYVLRVPGQTGYRFRLSDQLLDYWDGEPGAGNV